MMKVGGELGSILSKIKKNGIGIYSNDRMKKYSRNKNNNNNIKKHSLVAGKKYITI